MSDWEGKYCEKLEGEKPAFDCKFLTKDDQFKKNIFEITKTIL